jgi:hypothetical protein
MAGRLREYPPELRERAVRLVAECRPDHASEGGDAFGRAEAEDGDSGDGVQVGSPGRFPSAGTGSTAISCTDQRRWLCDLACDLR